MFSYDLNGNQTGWQNINNGTYRSIVWDDENRIQSVSDGGSTSNYVYDFSGERVIKRTSQGETVYVNQFYTVRNGSVESKHYFAGKSRIASQLSGHKYYYHPDHLGSTNYVTDETGSIYEHMEYFPFGESWVEERGATEKTPYLFTSKELDEETGLYYFGARYYDARTSVWASADPILEKYLPTGNLKKDADMGTKGVFTSVNINLYTYAALNPVKFIDPDGKKFDTAPVLANDTSIIAELNTVVTHMDKKLNTAWKNSKHGTNDAREHGGWIAYNPKMAKYTNWNLRKGEKEGMTPHPNYAKLNNETTQAFFHTHPLGKKYVTATRTAASLRGAAPSGEDIDTHAEGFTGNVSFIEAGSKRFAIVITNKAQAKNFASTFDIVGEYDSKFNSTTGSHRHKTREAARHVINQAGSGMRLYETIDAAKKNFSRVY